jgi:hypothetical protein
MDLFGGLGKNGLGRLARIHVTLRLRSTEHARAADTADPTRRCCLAAPACYVTRSEAFLDVAACDSFPAVAPLTVLHATRSESVRHPGGDIVDVLTRTGLFEEGTGKEVRVDYHQRYMAIELPLGLRGRLTPDITRTARKSRADQVDGRSINAIVQALPPKENPVGGYGHVLCQMNIERGMEIDKVGRTNQGDLPEIGPFREEGIESLEIGPMRVKITAGDISL